MVCWNPSHLRHIWPTTTNSKFWIQDCEVYCFYCFGNGKYEGKHFSKTKELRQHVVEAHLSEGALKGVDLMCGNGHLTKSRKWKNTKKRKSYCLPDRTLDPEVQISQLASIFWLSPEHHVSFRRLIRIFLSRHASDLENAVASFLRVYGSMLWPDDPEPRHHLSPPEIPSLASYFGSTSKPTYSLHGKMSTYRRSQYLMVHEGREPNVVEHILASPLGKAINRYLKLLQEVKELETAAEPTSEGFRKSLGNIMGHTDGVLVRLDDLSLEEDRQSSPDLPLRVASRKRKRSTQHRPRDSSPEVALAKVSKSQKTTATGGEAESSLDTSPTNTCEDIREAHPMMVTSSDEIRVDTAVQRDGSGVSIAATTVTKPLEIGNPDQPTIQALSDPAEHLPLWDKFLKSAEQQQDEVNILNSDLERDCTKQQNAPVDGPGQAYSLVLGQELQTSTLSPREISPRSQNFPAFEQHMQYSALPNNGYRTHSHLSNVRNHSTYEDAERQSFPNFAHSVLGFPGAAPPYIIVAAGQLRGSAGSAGPGDTAMRGYIASRLHPLVAQPVYSSRNDPHRHSGPFVTTNGQVRRDFVMADGSFPPPLFSPSEYFAPAAPNTADQRHPSIGHFLSHLPMSNTRIFIPRAIQPEIEGPNVENRLDRNRTMLGSSASYDDERVTHRARLDVYRRETAYMGGLPMVLLTNAQN